MSAWPDFSPEAKARRERAAARKARHEEVLRDAAADVLASGPPVLRGVLDQAIEGRIATAPERTALKRARDPVAVQAAARALRAKQAEFQQAAAAAKPTPPAERRPTVDQWLESLSAEQRAAIETSEHFAGLSEQAQEYILRRRDALEEVLEEAEWRAAQTAEDDRVRALEDGQFFDWSAVTAEHDGLEEGAFVEDETDWSSPELDAWVEDEDEEDEAA